MNKDIERLLQNPLIEAMRAVPPDRLPYYDRALAYFVQKASGMGMLAIETKAVFIEALLAADKDAADSKL